MLQHLRALPNLAHMWFADLVARLHLCVTELRQLFIPECPNSLPESSDIEASIAALAALS